MDFLAIAFVVFSAVLHAGWNILGKAIPDQAWHSRWLQACLLVEFLPHI